MEMGGGGGGGVPVATGSSPSALDEPHPRLETPLTSERFPAVIAIQKQFLNSKRCLCLIPCGMCEGMDEFAERHRQHPERLGMAAVAVGADGQAVGFVQMSMVGMQSFDERLFHKVGPGEAYIESMAVLDGNRGTGLGKEMLSWCEKRAREQGAAVLTLGVINGNPAQRLYERFGFVATPRSPCAQMVSCCCLTVLFGRPYGCCDAAVGVTLMHKPLA
ncbi:acyl-CoA N-acyltransferase [Baffinella frigidus]|nr:acyl-CoA N-acyltransferase [Cryptophyta sp. CCMP2293]